MHFTEHIARMTESTVAMVSTVHAFFVRYQVFSRLIWLGVGPTAVLIVMELSAVFTERVG